MDFDKASDVEQVCWDLKWHDQLAAADRMLVNRLFDGRPPYTDEEVAENQIEVNKNDLTAPRVAHQAIRQYERALLSPEQLFTVTLDYGPVWKRQEWGNTITREINKPLKGDRAFYENECDVFKQTVLHGVGPVAWFDREKWRPKMMGIEDVLLPSKTLVSMSNLNYFGLFVQFTEEELDRLTNGPKVDPGWNMPLVKKALEWVKKQKGKTFSEAEAFSPEKVDQMDKAKRGLFSDDSTPTVDAWMFFYYSDEGRSSGWRRKMVLDTPMASVAHAQTPSKPDASTKSFMSTRGEFLYNSKSRKFADDLDQCLHFQFGNTSVVAPSYYHTVRGLGWLLYSVCHFANRLSCRIDESSFESLMQYFWANGERDVQRIQQINLTHKKVLPEGLRFVRPEERWQVQSDMVSLTLANNRQIIAETATSYAQDLEIGQEASPETATKTMAKINSSAAIVGSMLEKAYIYQTFKYIEIARRFCMKDSNDPDVKRFRVECLKAGIPEDALNAARWDVKPSRVIGSGNLTLRMAMSDKLMAGAYTKVGPEAQKKLLREFISANSQVDAMGHDLVPDVPTISDSVRNAQRDAAVLLAGLPIAMEDASNHEEVIQVYLTDMAQVVQQVQQAGGVADAKTLAGLQNIAGMSVQGQPLPGPTQKFSNIRSHLALLAENKEPDTKKKVKELGDAFGKLMNLVKAMAQRSQEQGAKGKEAGGGIDPADGAKIAGAILMTKTKAKLASESHAARTAQKQITWEQQQKQQAERHQQELKEAADKHRLEMASSAVKALQPKQNPLAE